MWFVLSIVLLLYLVDTVSHRDHLFMKDRADCFCVCVCVFFFCLFFFCFFFFFFTCKLVSYIIA